MKICYQVVLLNKLGKLREIYLQKKKKANSTGEGSVEWIWYSQMEEILSQSKAINPDYIADSSTLDSDNEDLIDKENHDEVNKPQKKKKKSGIEGLSGVIAERGESRD